MSIVLDGSNGLTTPGVVNTAGETIATTLSVTGATNLAVSSGNVGIGTANPQSTLDLGDSTIGRGITWQGSSGAGGYGSIWTQYSAGTLWMGSGFISSTASNAYVSTVSAASVYRSGISLEGTSSSGIRFFTDGAATIAKGSAYVPTEQARIDSAGLFKFNSGYGSAATAYGCRAWVNFNGTGTVAIRASGNVSSITDNGTGDYTVNFTTAMVDANYGYEVSGREDESATLTWGALAQPARVAQTTTTFRIITKTAAGAAFDFNSVSLAVFR